jgi:hypothetical protein
VGFVFTKEAGYIGVDLDNCIDGDNLLRYNEHNWVHTLKSYTEVSPSGTGVKVIFEGTLPETLTRRSFGGNGIYDSGRFFTVTGQLLNSDPLSETRFIDTVSPDTLAPLLDTWFPPQEQAAGNDWFEVEETLTDNEVMVHLNREQNAQHSIRLYNGRWQEAGYDSQSEADLALVGKLAFYWRPCPGQIDRLFRASGLMREKWDDTRGGGQTYGERTIEKALAGKTEYYNRHPGNVVEEASAPVVKTAEVRMEENTTPRWKRSLKGYAGLRTADRPDMLHSIVDYLQPLGGRLGDDWLDIMALSFYSSLWPDARFENLPLNLWSLGVSAQGVGKSVVGDELDKLAHDVAHFQGQSLLRYSSGTSAGLVRRLDGTGRSVLAYLSEWTGFAKSITQDYNSSMKETLLDLYDGRNIYHQLANETVNVVKPYLVLSGVTTKAAFVSAADAEDAGNGFYSRFIFVAPNPTRGTRFQHRADHERGALVEELAAHMKNIPDFSAITFDSKDTPVALEEYLGHLGVVDDGSEIDLDALPTHGAGEEETPTGRLHARVKKVCALLELLEARPNVRRGILYVTEENVARAVRLVQRGNAYSERVLGWLSRSKDEMHMAMVQRALKGGGMTLAGIMSDTHLPRQAVEGTLDLLEGEGVVVAGIEEGRRVYSRR